MKSDSVLQVTWRKQKGWPTRNFGRWHGLVWVWGTSYGGMSIERKRNWPRFRGKVAFTSSGLLFDSLAEAKTLLPSVAIESVLKKKGYSEREARNMASDLSGVNGEEARKFTEGLLALDGAV